MRKPGESLKVLSSTASGVVIPYSMMDVQGALSRRGHQVYVQDIASMGNLHEGMIAILDGLVSTVRAFAAGTVQSDDMTAVVVRYDG